MKKDIIESTETTDPYSRVVSGYHKDELIQADGTYFHHATLDKCIITYSGGDVSWVNLKTINCTFRFLSSAQKTINFLTGFKAPNNQSNVVNLEDLPIINDHKN